MITKNKQSNENIKKMARAAFPNKSVVMIEVFYREYEDKGQYQWAREMLLSVL